MPSAVGVLADSYNKPATGGGPSLPVLAGLLGWFDADAASTFDVATGVVWVWRDRSPNAYHAIPPTGYENSMYLPSRVTAAINGRAAVLFDTSTGSQAKGLSTPMNGAAQPHTTIAVISPGVVLNGSGRDHVGLASPANMGTALQLTSDGRPSMLVAGWGTAGSGTAATVVGQAAVVGWSFDAAGNWKNHLNGVANGAGNYGSTVPTETRPTQIGASNMFGGGAFNGYIAEVVKYDRVLSDTERQQVESYLWGKWIGAPGLPVTTGVAGWWDADDAATITHTAGAVTKWNDKSGLTRHAVENGTPSNRPTTGTRTINGRNTLDIAGTGQWLKTPGWVQAQPVTVFAVGSADNGPGAANAQIVCNVATSPTVWLSGTVWSLYAGAVLSSAVVANTSPHVTSSVFNGASSQMWLDGTSVVTGNAGSTGFTNGSQFGTDGSGNWDGPIAEVIIYDRVLSTVERQQVENYLWTKWMAKPNDPLTMIPWHAAYWASDPAWTPPADGAAVTTWRDGSGNSRTMTAVTGSPIYRAASSVLNGKPAIEFNGTAAMNSGVTFAAVPHPVVFVAVLRANATTPDHYFASGPTGSTWDISGGVQGGNWVTRTNATISGPAADTSKHFVDLGIENTSYAIIAVDGVVTYVGGVGDGGETTSGPWRIGEGLFAQKGNYTIAFVGFLNRMLSTYERANLLAWSRSFYGTP